MKHSILEIQYKKLSADFFSRNIIEEAASIPPFREDTKELQRMWWQIKWVIYQINKFLPNPIQRIFKWGTEEHFFCQPWSFVEKYITALDFLDVKPRKVIFSLTQLRRRFFCKLLTGCNRIQKTKAHIFDIMLFRQESIMSRIGQIGKTQKGKLFINYLLTWVQSQVS